MQPSLEFPSHLILRDMSYYVGSMSQICRALLRACINANDAVKQVRLIVAKDRKKMESIRDSGGLRAATGRVHQAAIMSIRSNIDVFHERKQFFFFIFIGTSNCVQQQCGHLASMVVVARREYSPSQQNLSRIVFLDQESQSLSIIMKSTQIVNDRF